MRFLFIIAVFVVACSPSGDDHGHAHGSDAEHSHELDARPVSEILVRVEGLEVYIKYAALLAGSPSNFETYITKLGTQSPLDSAKVTISIVKDGKGIRHSVDAPNKNGVFLPSLVPGDAGTYQLIADLEFSGKKRRIELGDTQVYASLGDISPTTGHDSGVNISFTKPQAWEIGLETVEVTNSQVFEIINTSGVWKAAPGDSKAMVANASGIVNFNRENLTVGTLVNKGQPLMTITSRGLTTNNLEVEIEKAKADHNQIKAEYDRQKLLYESNLIAKAEFERSESKFLVSKASIESLQQGYIKGGKQIQVPFDGFVKSIEIHNGDYASQGAVLFTVVSSHSQLLETQIGPSYSLALSDINDIWFKQNNEWSSMSESGGSVLSIGKEVSSHQPLIPLFAKINTPVSTPQGGFAEVQIAIGSGKTALVVPESALMEDYGKFSVIVQLSAETYEKRSIVTGNRNGDMVEIINGLEKGEYVVSSGAYQVKMASMASNVPAHGHEH